MSKKAASSFLLGFVIIIAIVALNLLFHFVQDPLPELVSQKWCLDRLRHHHRLAGVG
jgi:hypothetical protein